MQGRALDRVLSAAPLPDNGSAIWQRLSSDRELIMPMLQFLRESFGLTPAALWDEALRVAFLPTVPNTSDSSIRNAGKRRAAHSSLER